MSPTESSPDENPYASPSEPSEKPPAEPVITNEPIPPGTVPTYGLEAFFCLVMCLSPVALWAIFHAGRVNYKLAQGDLEGAKIASQKAKNICWLCVFLTIALPIAALGIMSAWDAIN
jgi:hypothetical protein